METVTGPNLLDVCVRCLDSQMLDKASELALRSWWLPQRRRGEHLIGEIRECPVADWTRMILAHRAHRHPWYDLLANEITLQEFAAFMLENRSFPPFLPLAERVLKAQICDEARAALQRNIDDEQVPVPHAELMQRLMGALKARTGDGLPLEMYPALVDRTLVYYYGYYLDPWSLIGSMYVTEAVAYYRLQDMNTGLRRVGLRPDDLEFIRVHMACDQDHAHDWSDCVIGPTLRLNPNLRTNIAEGIAIALETSARYLDRLVAGATERRARLLT
jgi:Iron-containing redox enzyme